MSLLAAFVLLSRLLLTVNDAAISKAELVSQAEATLYATTLAQAMIQEVSLKYFDQRTVKTPATSPDSLSPAEILGADLGEVFPNFNDLDDYHGYKRSVANPRLGAFRTSVRVSYANANGDSVKVRTYFKKITVTVSGNSEVTLKHPIELASLISY